MPIIPGYKGGIADSLYEPISKQTYQTAKNLDVLSGLNILKSLPVSATITQPSGDGMSEYKPLGIIKGTDAKYYLLGKATISSTNTLVLHSSSDLSTWTLVFRTSAATINGAIEEFKDGIFFGHTSSSVAYLRRFGNLAGTDATFTVTIASPAVFTATGHGLAAGDSVIFSTTGALPTGLTVGTVYYVISGGLTADAFEVSTTPGGSAVNTSGSQSGTHSINYACKIVSSGLTSEMTFLRAHKDFGKLFFIHDSGKKIGSYTGATQTTVVTLAALTLGTDDVAVGIEPYGNFSMVGIRNTNGASRFLKWDGSSTTVYDSTLLSDTGLQTFRISNENIHYITGNNITGSPNYKYYIGLNTDPIKEFKLGTVTGSVNCNPYAVDFMNGSFIFGFEVATATLLDQVIWLYGSGNKNYPKLLTPWRTRLSAVTTDTVFIGLKNFSDRTVVIFRNNADDTYVMEQWGNSATTNDDGVYKSNAFALNNGKLDTIKRILILHSPLAASCGFTLKLKHIGHYPVSGSVLSEDSFTAIPGPQGNSSAPGQAQSTTNATYTVIEDVALFKEARFAQIEIDWDEVNSSNSAEIIFPIFIETVNGNVIGI